MIQVSLNGEWLEVKAMALSDALAHWDYQGRKCAVAVNGEFVPRADYAKLELKEGDTIDIVAPVGGG